MVELVALLVLIGSTVVAVLGVPLGSWTLDPCHVATVGAIATTAALIVSRGLGDRGARHEPLIAAGFLTAMPLVYVATALLVGASPRVVAIELGAVPLYGALAWLGLRRSPWLLAIGIAAHGVAWDAWHLGDPTVVPHWYARGCLVLDVALGLYLVARVRRWRAIAPHMVAWRPWCLGPDRSVC